MVGWLVLEKLRSSTFKSSRVVGGGTGGDRNNIFSNNNIIIMRIFVELVWTFYSFSVSKRYSKDFQYFQYLSNGGGSRLVFN